MLYFNAQKLFQFISEIKLSLLVEALNMAETSLRRVWKGHKPIRMLGKIVYWPRGRMVTVITVWQTCTQQNRKKHPCVCRSLASALGTRDVSELSRRKRWKEKLELGKPCNLPRVPFLKHFDPFICLQTKPSPCKLRMPFFPPTLFCTSLSLTPGATPSHREKKSSDLFDTTTVQSRDQVLLSHPNIPPNSNIRHQLSLRALLTHLVSASPPRPPS